MISQIAQQTAETNSHILSASPRLFCQRATASASTCWVDSAGTAGTAAESAAGTRSERYGGNSPRVRAAWTPVVRSSSSSGSIRPSAYASVRARSTTSRSASEARIEA